MEQGPYNPPGGPEAMPPAQAPGPQSPAGPRPPGQPPYGQQQPGQQPYPAYQAPPAAGGQRTSGKAIAALVCGIISLIVLPIIFTPIAIVLGVIALQETKRDPTLQGRGMAIAGIVLGPIGLIAGIIVGIAVFS